MNKRSSARKQLKVTKAPQENAAADMYANPAANTGFGSSSAVNGGFYLPYRISLDYATLLAIYRSSWIVRAIIDTLPEDMLKEFPSLEIDAEPEEIEDFERVIAKTMTLQKVIEGLKWGRLFGGALAIIILSGEGQKDLSQPLELDSIQPDSYRGLIIVDRWSGVSPSSELITNIDNPAEYGLPQYYDVTTEASQNFRVHHSRCLRFIGRDLPLFERQIQTYWGMSEIECVFEDLKRYDFCLAGIADLIQRAHVLIMKEPMLAQMLSGVSLTQKQYTDYVSKLQAVSQSISTNGIMALSEKGELQAQTYSFGGLSDIGRMYMTQMCGAAGYPMSRLFGQTNTGLGQSGEGDLQTYYDSADQKRRRELRPILDKLIPVICMSTYGEVPKDLDYNFPAIRSVTDEEKASLAEKSTGAIIEAYNADLITKRQAVMELQRSSGTNGLFAGITDEALQAVPEKYASEMGTGEIDPGEEEDQNSDGVKDSDPDELLPSVLAMKDNHGIDVCIENRKGSVRSGKKWTSIAPADYGFIWGTTGADGDEVDCYVGPNPESGMAFIVDQNRVGSPQFDEHKVMLGYRTMEDAQRDYLRGHTSGDKIFRGITPMTIARLKAWLNSDRTTIPLC